MGFFGTVGIGSSLKWKLLSVSWPLTMEILWDLLGLIFLRSHLMFPRSLSSRGLLMDAFAVVILVMSSMYALIGERHNPSNSLGHNAKENVSFHIPKTDLADGLGIIFFGN